MFINFCVRGGGSWYRRSEETSEGSITFAPWGKGWCGLGQGRRRKRDIHPYAAKKGGRGRTVGEKSMPVCVTGCTPSAMSDQLQLRRGADHRRFPAKKEGRSCAPKESSLRREKNGVKSCSSRGHPEKDTDRENH